MQTKESGEKAYLDKITLTKESGWQTIFEDLPSVYIEDGEEKEFSYSVDEDSVPGWKGSSNATKKDDGTVSIILTNKPVPTGDLTVKKTVSGSGGDQNKEFTFTVTMNQTDITGQYGDMTFTDGVAAFTLKHGQSKTATGLPAGV